VLRECWVHGIIDENTLVWGQGLVDWLPIRNVRTLVAQIRTPEGAFLDSHGAASNSMLQDVTLHSPMLPFCWLCSHQSVV
jgi:GYF domain 2